MPVEDDNEEVTEEYLDYLEDMIENDEDEDEDLADPVEQLPIITIDGQPIKPDAKDE